MEDLEQTGLDTVDKFITTWNSRDAKLWASSLNFPHVRPSPFGTIEVSPDADTYISNVDFDRVLKTGWDHSEWDYKRVIHTSASKIHVAGQWSRYNTKGQVILTTPITYVVTIVDNKWGIQSRFGSDYAGDEDTSGFESRVFKHLESFINHLNNNNRDACAELINYPHYVIGKGELKETPSADAFQLPDNKIHVDSMMALQAGNRSANLALDLSVFNDAGNKNLQAVISVTERDGHLGIQAWSLLDPTEGIETEDTEDTANETSPGKTASN